MKWGFSMVPFCYEMSSWPGFVFMWDSHLHGHSDKRTNMQLPLQAVTQCLPHNTPDLLTMFGKQHEQRRHCATVLWKCLNAFKTFW